MTRMATLENVNVLILILGKVNVYIYNTNGDIWLIRTIIFSSPSKMDFIYTSSTFLIVPALLLLVIFSALMSKLYIGKSVSNPQYAPVVGTVFHQLFYYNRLHDYLTDLGKRHRTFRLLAPDQSELYTTDVQNIEHILKTSFNKYSKGDINVNIISDLFGQGIFAVDGVKWRRQRKFASHEFSTGVLRDFSCTIFRKNAAKLVKTVSEFARAGTVFDVQELLMRCALQSIFKVGFGVDLNCLEGSGEKEKAFIKAFDDSNALTFWRYVDPTWQLKRFFNIGSEASLHKNIKIIHDYVQNLISEKREVSEMQHHTEDILSRLLIESRKDPENMNDQYLMDVILNFILAGKDSTANTLSWFFYVVCKNPLVQERILLEIRDVFGSKYDKSSIEDFVETISDEVLEKMHYLHAALSETLRLYPAVPVNGRCSEEDDILPDGNKLKKGDGVYYISYAMGRMPHIWGDDAEDFRPERWLNSNGLFVPESPFKFIAFHAGPRICLGKDFAYRQMKILTIALLRFIQFELADEKANVTYRTMFTLHINGGLHLRAVQRPA
ncbi:cytochrome P450 704C1-like isoform X2 [Apium graveolens]|uniref:cytochrome P450 704C1-like isoform X2 n=1 Tax=Apium graveolens TaxID=4045 RepID=UPI003D7A7EB7